MSINRTLVTAALLYANGSLHFGHLAGAYLPADCFARYRRLQGGDVLFICGSDEYGIAITMSAEKAGKTPKEQVDFFHKENQELFQAMSISFDYYGRTTSDVHKQLTQEFFLQLVDKKLVQEKETAQLYSAVANKFLADRYVTGTCPKCGFREARGDECQQCGAIYDAMEIIDPICKMSGEKLSTKKSVHWFFSCDHFANDLREWIDSKQWKSNVTNFVLPYLNELKPRAITRDLNWGVPVPIENSSKVLYVWFDAPIGYISASIEWAQSQGNKELWKEYWLDKGTEIAQFIGKDNILFHAIFFPAMIMGQDKDYNLVDNIVANEFFHLEGKQFSKSDGWYIDLKDFLTCYPADALRYYLASNAPEQKDAEFAWQEFQKSVNIDLVGKFGNFVHRTLSMVEEHIKVVPEPGDYLDEDYKFFDDIDSMLSKISGFYDSCELRKAAKTLMKLATIANGYFDALKPWHLVKSNVERFNTVIYCALFAIKSLALAAFPILPNSADAIWHMLGGKGSIADNKWDTVAGHRLTPGNKLNKPVILFNRIEDEAIANELAKLSLKKI